MVAVPETAVDEDHGMVFWQDHVGLSRERAVLGPVHGEAVAEALQHRAQGQLGLGVATADARHDLGALGRSENIGHDRTKS